jgi:2-dehydro-3-deoxy-D-gluconate 5-dehydrogenase
VILRAIFKRLEPIRKELAGANVGCHGHDKNPGACCDEIRTAAPGPSTFLEMWRIRTCAPVLSQRRSQSLAQSTYNAGVIRRAPAAEYPMEFWDELIAVNLTAVFRLSQLAGRHMFEREARGKILNIASLLSFQGGILVPAYAAAKGGIAQ